MDWIALRKKVLPERKEESHADDPHHNPRDKEAEEEDSLDKSAEEPDPEDKDWPHAIHQDEEDEEL